MTKRKPKRTHARCRAWGKLGGEARAVALSPQRRSEIARTAARARWGVKRDQA